jgi:hypothetical protein
MSQECGITDNRQVLIIVTFMVTRPPIDPVRLVREICIDTLNGSKRTRWAQRFTPIESTCYANLPDLRVMAEKVLTPIFHPGDDRPAIKVSGMACSNLI